MLTYQGNMEDDHLRQVIRVALVANNLALPRDQAEQAAHDAIRLGTSLRDEALPAWLPAFIDPGEHHRLSDDDPYLWNRLPHVASFGYRQTQALRGGSGTSGGGDDLAALAGASFNVGIGTVDYLVDECIDAGSLFQVLDRPFLAHLFTTDPGDNPALRAAWAGATHPTLRFLIGHLAGFAALVRELYETTGNAGAWSDLLQVIDRLYQAEKTISTLAAGVDHASPEIAAAIEIKSTWPSLALRHIVHLSTAGLGDPDRSRAASERIGRTIWYIDDLVDVLQDTARDAPNRSVLRIARAVHAARRPYVDDADVYDEIARTASEIAAMIELPAGAEPEPGAPAAFARESVWSWVGWQDGVLAGQPAAGEEAPGTSLQAAVDMIIDEQRCGYGEAIHHLNLPRLVDGEISYETHPALLFQRATVLDALLDARDAGLAVPAPVIAREVMAILQAKHRDATGGWNYIAGVPELPPDADDLGMVLQVLVRAGGAGLASVCREAIDLALASAGPDGGIPTWILDDPGASTASQAMRPYIDVVDGRGAHADVVANLLLGLLLLDPERDAEAIRRGARFLESQQDGNGAWRSRWYAGPFYGTYRVVSVLARVAPGGDACVRARAFLRESQGEDGSWGDPLSTALAALALRELGDEEDAEAALRAVTSLAGRQERDGGWPASPFISFPYPRSDRVETFASRTISTAFCLKCLLAGATGSSSVRAFLRTAEPSRPVAPEPAGGWA